MKRANFIEDTLESILIFKEDELLSEELENRVIPDFMINLIKIENRLKENRVFYKIKPTIPKKNTKN